MIYLAYKKNWHKFLKVPFLTKASVCYLFFSPNDNPSKAMKNDFCFTEKAVFLFEVLKYLCLLPFLHFPDSKGQMERKQFMMS